MAEAPAGTATILFTDVVGSTQMRTRLGDAAADDLMRRHERILADLVTGEGGTVVKGLGDGIMATFGAAADAVLAATGSSARSTAPNRQAREDRRIEVRVGLSAGDVSWDDGDCHGTPVVTASPALRRGRRRSDPLRRPRARPRARSHRARVLASSASSS